MEQGRSSFCADVLVTSEQRFSDSELAGLMDQLSLSKVVKQIFQIPLRTIFLHALQSIGIIEPVFIDVFLRGSYQVHIEFESDLEMCILAGSKFAKIAGDVCATYELAEAIAIRKALLYLSLMHNVVLVDISSRKESILLKKSRDLYGNVIDGLQMVDFILKKWAKCLDKLFQVENFAYLKLKHGADVELRFAEPVYQFLQHITRGSMNHIRSFDEKMKELSVQKDNYVQASRSKSFNNSKGSIKKAYHHEVDVLALLLKWLNLEDCQYAASIGDDGLFLGAVMLSFGHDQTMAPNGDMCIEAVCAKRTIEKAHNAAAREAIFLS